MARQRLATAPFRPDTREATLLLGHILGWTEAQVIARQDRSLEPREARRFESLVDRRLTGEPYAYIVGVKEFYGRRFRVDCRVLIPRPETEHLVEVALQLPLPPRPSILDLGTGSGCLAATLALEMPTSSVVATDVSVDALAVAQDNRDCHALTGRLRLLAGDLADALDLQGFDLVVSNPPYIGRGEAPSISPEILDFEPDTALFAEADGGALYQRLLTELAGLRTDSWLVVEIGSGQRDLIRRLAAESAFRLDQLHVDYSGHPRIAVLQRR